MAKAGTYITAYSVSSKKFSVKDIVVATETACKDIPGDKAAELRARVVNVIKTTKPPTSNITKEERLALNKLKKDTEIIIVPGDKGRATCVIDSAVYEEKANALLQDVNVYERLQKDPTQKYQTKLIKLLKDLKDKGAIDSRTYWKLYPTVCDVPKFYGLIKIHKAGAPLRPIISSIGSATYELARFVSGIISPLIGNTEHHITNTQSFVEDIRDLKLESDESLVSFDVSALFTSIPVDKTLEVVGELLKSDSSWKKGEAENLEPEQVLDCLSFCLYTSYCVFRDTFYLQRYGCAMGSSCSPLSADAYMEYFESQALTSATHPPRVWKRYVDDTFVVIKLLISKISLIILITLIRTSSLRVRKKKTANFLPGYSGLSSTGRNSESQSVPKTDTHRAVPELLLSPPT
ncbi:uncharacterized protein [Amphiura filiformis]|uniref:uncharacterized protein n=1 Tax=Amphiura filiformis TaxID=82378 RepID=UPI003B20CA3A